ncbi:MFS transporter [Chloroflexota bacterium]
MGCGEESALSTNKHSGVFYGWWIVLASGIIILFTDGLVSFSLTAFFTPIIDHFGWSYAALSLVFSLRAVEMGIASPVIGVLTDRVGPRKVAFVGAFLAGLGMILLSRVSSLAMFYLVFIMVSVGLSGCSSQVQIVAVANWFRRRIGTATGLLQMGGGAGSLTLPLAVWLITQYSWQTSLVVLGICIWVVCLPLSLVVRHKPEQYGYHPDGDTDTFLAKESESKEDTTSAVLPEVEYSAREALRTRSFWMLMLTGAVGIMGLGVILLHYMPYLESVGISRETAGRMMIIFAAFNIASRFGFGWLGDRFAKKNLFAIILALEAIGLLTFAYARSAWGVVPFLITFGPAWGGLAVVMLTIQREYFGRSAFGSVRGLMLAGIVVPIVAAPAVVGWVFDVRGSYHLAWLVLAALCAAAVPLALRMKPPVKKAAGV